VSYGTVPGKTLEDLSVIIRRRLAASYGPAVPVGAPRLAAAIVNRKPAQRTTPAFRPSRRREQRVVADVDEQAGAEKKGESRHLSLESGH
jgi:hypothetical protein